MVDQVLSKTWAQLEQINDDADAGNIGKTVNTEFSGDLDVLLTTGFFGVAPGATNNPAPGFSGVVMVTMSISGRGFQMFSTTGDDQIYFRGFQGSVWAAWQEIFHTGNTGLTQYNGTETVGTSFVDLASGGDSTISVGNDGTSAHTSAAFRNANGQVGTIVTSASATAYNTSSDPRLKDFELDLPTDDEINNEFNTLFSCFKTFHWKNDPGGKLVWGFDAHACVDADLDMGTEGKGSRDSNLGDVYKTTPAVIEQREQQVHYKTGEKKGELRFNPDNSPMMEMLDIEIRAKIDHKVSPAGIDQAKAVPILLAKIEQLERRLSMLEA